MELKIKNLKWSAGIPVAMLNKETAEKIGVHANDRISIRTISKNSREISAIVDIVEKLVKKDEIAISLEIKHNLKLKVRQKVDVNFMSPPKSMKSIKKKIDGKNLNRKEMYSIINDLMNDSLSESELALFILGMYRQKTTMKETIYLIEAISDSGSRFKLKNKFVVDKHSIGGISGNRTTPLVVSICAAAGLIIPKSSSRAITSAAGTPDVMEVLTPVEFSIQEVKKIVQKTGGCMVWGGATGMVPADAKLIKIEKQLEIDPPSQMIASIMAKKLATGADYILIDIPYGKTAKVNKKSAIELKKKFEYLGKHFKKKLRAVLTDGEQPIGNAVGPVLEMIDILKILDPEKRGPRDLEEKALFLAGEILEMTGKAKKGKGKEMARGVLLSGKAFSKFKEIISAQGGKLREFKSAKFSKDIRAKKSGKILEIHNKKINALARIAGSPMDKSAGLYIYHHVREKVKKGDKLLTIYSESKSRLNESVRFYNNENPIMII